LKKKFLKQSNHLVILGAGKPHYGKDLAALKKIYKNFYSLNLILNYSKNRIKKITYVTGYQNLKIKKKFPNINFITNKNWRSTGPIFSLKNFKFDQNENLIIIYSDILINRKIFELVINENKDFLCLIDSTNKKEIINKNDSRILKKERVFFNNKKEILFSYKNYFKNSSELIGLIKVPKQKLDSFKIEIDNLNKIKNNYKLFDLLEKIKKKISIKFIDVKDDWIEINNKSDITNFILKSKSEALNNLKEIIRKSEILDLIKFNQSEWKVKRKDILKTIEIKFKNKKLIVRSSAVDEDGEKFSNAGKYLSILNVSGQKNIESSINQVIDSFNENLNNEIFIQEYISNCKYVGVLTTKSKNLGSPWYVINYQKTNDTEIITKGITNNNRTIYIRRDFEIKNIKDSFVKKIVIAAKELERILISSNLDIEFGILNNEKIYIFQVRTLNLIDNYQKNENKVLRLYKEADQKYNKVQLNDYLKNKYKFFGLMPDWNPVEILGFKPNNLSISIYESIITNNVWSKQRYEFGYRKINSPKLIKTFCGTPYVAVHKTLESFIPSSLNNNISKKILKNSLEKLEKNPSYHDKIEFEVIPNCLDFDFSKWNKFFLKKNFSKIEIKKIKKSLFQINKNALSLYFVCLKKLKIIEKRNDKLKLFKNKIDKISYLLLLIKQHTLIFSHFARCGFVSVIIMNSALKKKIINKKQYDIFFNSINTISKEFQNDLTRYNQKKILKKEIVKKYGHLRPGTYDINSKRYDENISFLFNQKINKKIVKINEKKKKDVFSKEFISHLKQLGFNENKNEIVNFFYGSIEKREYSKFLFTKYLSELLRYLSVIFKRYKLTKYEISLLTVKDLIDFINKKISFTNLKKKIERNDNLFKLNLRCEMPNLITKVSDLSYYELTENEPNFVGSKTVDEHFIRVLKLKNYSSLNGKIVLIDSADPGYDWIFTHRIKALITKYGGVNSHMSIRCAELNLTAAIGVGEKIFQSLINKNKIFLDPVNKVLK
jgi:choline kinase